MAGGHRTARPQGRGGRTQESAHGRARDGAARGRGGAVRRALVKEIGEAPPFSGFERTIAARYLRARRKEGFISVIAGFSFVGIALGVATLIIVMAVMNGFRTELL